MVIKILMVVDSILVMKGSLLSTHHLCPIQSSLARDILYLSSLAWDRCVFFIFQLLPASLCSDRRDQRNVGADVPLLT